MNNGLGSRIKFLREKANLSRSDFAAKYWISAYTLRDYENGITNIPSIKRVFFESIFKNLGFELTPSFSSETSPPEGIISTINFDKNDLSIKREIDFFKSQNSDYLLYTINNESMSPIFNIGDMKSTYFPLLCDLHRKYKLSYRKDHISYIGN